MAAQEPLLMWQKSCSASFQVQRSSTESPTKTPTPPCYEPGNFCTEWLKRLPAPFICPPGMDLLLLHHGHSSEDTRARRTHLKDVTISSTPACSGQNPEKLWQRHQTGEIWSSITTKNRTFDAYKEWLQHPTNITRLKQWRVRQSRAAEEQSDSLKPWTSSGCWMINEMMDLPC